MLWLHEHGLANRIRWLAEHATPVLGICGGYQMLGNVVLDPGRLESEVVTASGLALLPLQTNLGGTKRLARTGGRVHAGLPGIWTGLVESRSKAMKSTSDEARARSGHHCSSSMAARTAM